MRRQIRNVLLVITAFLLTVLFCFFPNIQSRLTDWKTFGKSENLSLNPVKISVESTQTTLEKLKIINNHILSVSVRPVSYTHLHQRRKQGLFILVSVSMERQKSANISLMGTDRKSDKWQYVVH